MAPPIVSEDDVLYEPRNSMCLVMISLACVEANLRAVPIVLNSIFRVDVHHTKASSLPPNIPACRPTSESAASPPRWSMHAISSQSHFTERAVMFLSTFMKFWVLICLGLSLGTFHGIPPMFKARGPFRLFFFFLRPRFFLPHRGGLPPGLHRNRPQVYDSTLYFGSIVPPYT